MSDKNRIVLAYSGGLDTSVAIPYLKDRTGKDVVAVSLDVGQGGESLETIKERALACGAVEAYVSTLATSSPTSTACWRLRPTPCTKASTRWSPPSPAR